MVHTNQIPASMKLLLKKKKFKRDTIKTAPDKLNKTLPEKLISFFVVTAYKNAIRVPAAVKTAA